MDMSIMIRNVDRYVLYSTYHKVWSKEFYNPKIVTTKTLQKSCEK